MSLRDDSKQYHNDKLDSQLVVKPKKKSQIEGAVGASSTHGTARERIAKAQDDRRTVSISLRTYISLADELERFRRELEGESRRISLSQVCEQLLIDGLAHNGITYSRND